MTIPSIEILDGIIEYCGKVNEVSSASFPSSSTTSILSIPKTTLLKEWFLNAM